ncbi:LuxR C-terminal-related transcriptional regulator [Streptomyces sp. LaBMicrA B280]|uniref:helix-turn-helix transcriptional regulator n=1 Tax=Streptomyces sp. LaBMicrA B280 TaxID=3391001 RepID=UPI003BA47564
MTEPHQEHGVEELCAQGRTVYERALRAGRIDAADAAAAPCLQRLGLLQPTAADTRLLEPVAASVALQELLRASAERIAAERRRETRIARSLEPLLRTAHSLPGSTPVVRVHNGVDRINQILTAAAAEVREEFLAIQPHVDHTRMTPELDAAAFDRDQALLDRGARIRVLYQHTMRHSPTVLARYEHLRGDLEARTLDEVSERLLVFDRTMAFIPANAERTMALEIRQPAIVEHLATMFDRFWHLATPMGPRRPPAPAADGATPRQRAIAALLVEGHTDAAIGDRLGMNVRTVRLHVAKLSAALGSVSRAQLGYLIARSEILRRADEAPGS